MEKILNQENIQEEEQDNSEVNSKQKETKKKNEKIDIFEQKQIKEIIESNEDIIPFNFFYINDENEIYFLEKIDTSKNCHPITINFVIKNKETDKTKIKIKIIEEIDLILFKKYINNVEIEDMKINNNTTFISISIEIIKNKINHFLKNAELNVKIKNIISYLTQTKVLAYIKKEKLKDEIYSILKLNSIETKIIKQEKFNIFKNVYWFLENEFADKKDKKTYTPDDIGQLIANIVKELDCNDNLIIYDPFAGSGNLMLQLFLSENTQIKGIILNDKNYNLEGILEKNLYEFIQTFGITAPIDKLLLKESFNKDIDLPILTTSDKCGNKEYTKPNTLITNPDFVDKNYSNILNKIEFNNKEINYEITILNFKTQKLFLQVSSNLYINILKSKNSEQQFKYCIFLSNKIVKEFEGKPYDLYTIYEEDTNIFETDSNIFENKKLKIKSSVNFKYIKDNSFIESEIVEKIKVIKENDRFLKNENNFLIDNTLYYKNDIYDTKIYNIKKIEKGPEKQYNIFNNKLVCIVKNTINDNLLKIERKPNLNKIDIIFKDLHNNLLKD